jgi:D-3-phosphoglycerate dehydrogenase
LLEEFPNCRFNDEGWRLVGDDLVNFLGGAVGAIVGVERIDVPVVERLPQLRVVAKYGVGLDTIDVQGLEGKGVFVAWTPGTNATAVAEMALLLMLGVLRRLPEAMERVRTENWSPVTGGLLHGRTVGLVGVGHVGSALASLLAAFDCRILGFDVASVNSSIVTMTSLDDLLVQSDIVSIHVPLMPQTVSLIGSRELDLMKKGAVVVNTSRGPIIDEQALVERLQAGQLRGAGLDVLENEPPVSWEISRMSNLMLTPHIAGSSEESNLAMGMAAIDGLVSQRSLLNG